MRGRKPLPTEIKRMNGNPGKRPLNENEPTPPRALPDPPEHLSPAGEAEWHRIAETLYQTGVLTQVDRAALAAYCQAYGRWVEAELKLQQTPALIRTGSGHVQISPWLTVANRQLELMHKFASEFGMTPASRTRICALPPDEPLLPGFEGDIDPTDPYAQFRRH